ncbi:hypothetical protein AB0I91_13785 [Actinosynnema sp. NPDC049800]
MYRNDQHQRLVVGQSSSAGFRGDVERRVFARMLVRRRRVLPSRAAFELAMVMHHGTSLRDMHMANLFVEVAIKKAHPKARWLSAAIFDRGRILSKRPQYYGTQFARDQNSGMLHLHPVDGKCTDSERIELGLNTLAEIEAALASAS